MHMLHLTAVTLSTLAARPAGASRPRNCPPLGPVFPPARAPRSHPRMVAALEALSRDLLSRAAGWNNTALSVGVETAIDPRDDGERGPMLEVHYSPPRARDVDGETVYRVGSVSKVFAVLGAEMLAARGDLHLDDKVGRWIGELKEGSEGGVPWDEVTVGALATHMSGIGVDNLLAAYKSKRPPIYAPNHAPAYSNAGISLVGLVVEAAAGKPYDEVIRELILEPAGMRGTTVGGTLDNVSTIFVPVNNTEWNDDMGIFDAAGGMFTTTHDLLAFACAILRHGFLSPGQTRRWLKPTSFTSAWGTSVGAPWEILRLDELLPSGRIVDAYTKGGDIADYASALALVPDLGLAVTIMTAGPEMLAPSILLSRVFEGLVPALEAAARDEARQRYAGIYEDEATGSRIVLSVDEEGQGEGLLLTEWVMRGFNVLENLHRYSIRGIDDTETPPREGQTLRLFPALVERNGGTTEAWRAAMPPFTDDEAEKLDGELAWRDGTCLSWLLADRATYNYLAVDHFDLIVGDDGGREAVAIRPRAFALELVRTKTGPVQLANDAIETLETLGLELETAPDERQVPFEL
ncbi:Beta-lactamase-like protein like [Verticillium longisporum]|uniref:Beta-lactamase-like protein like n=1 Tax=Verticillium longisporum TaxID=100787 RepID=A0A8I2ZW22_VERLO|nr:Beta-lactamase-like protein like [Verticillium longisporum]